MLWSGRFSKKLDKNILDFTSSLDLDNRLYAYDIKGSIAHVKSMTEIGVIKKSEMSKIISTLGKIQKELETGRFKFKHMDEDIHMAIERRLIELIGDTGKKLHTGRSRNDQVSLDMKMYIKDVISEVNKGLDNFIKVLKSKASKHIDSVMPGYTHLQQAQPILFSQYILAYVEMFKRDKIRFLNAYDLADSMPLGAGALAGTPYNVNRKKLAKELGFKKITANSMDTVSDRDFILDFLYACSTFSMHCSRFAEDLIVYSSQEFGFIELDDAFTTGSSIMPQKKNPDVLELTRAKSERIMGALNSFINVMKALPLTYNRDMQEDKYYLFNAIDTTLDFLFILPQIVQTMKINDHKMQVSLTKGYLYATAIADYLVDKNVPFREAHRITGEIVSYAIKKNKSFQELTIDEYKKVSKIISKDIFKIFDPHKIINEQMIEGGTSKKSVKKQLGK
ncbi:argininosuccinate lyase [bacterium]